MKALLLVITVGVMIGCTPRNEEPSTPLPTRQTTIDPVTKKLDAAQQETEKRRADIDKAGQ